MIRVNGERDSDAETCDLQFTDEGLCNVMSLHAQKPHLPKNGQGTSSSDPTNSSPSTSINILNI